MGLAKLKARTAFTFAAGNLTRMATMFDWRLNTGQTRLVVAEWTPLASSGLKNPLKHGVPAKQRLDKGESVPLWSGCRRRQVELQYHADSTNTISVWKRMD